VAIAGMVEGKAKLHIRLVERHEFPSAIYLSTNHTAHDEGLTREAYHSRIESVPNRFLVRLPSSFGREIRIYISKHILEM